MQGRTVTTTHEATRKRRTKKIKSIQESKKIEIYYMQGQTATRMHGAKKKEQKRLKA